MGWHLRVAHFWGWHFRVAQGFGVTLHGTTRLRMGYFGGNLQLFGGGDHLPGVLGGAEQVLCPSHPTQPNLPQLARGVAKTLK